MWSIIFSEILEITFIDMPEKDSTTRKIPINQDLECTEQTKDWVIQNNWNKNPNNRDQETTNDMKTVGKYKMKKSLI